MTDTCSTHPPFFHEDDGIYVPTKESRGFWSPDSLSGRLVGGILGFAIEQEFGDPAFVPVRFCVDMIRMPPNKPLNVETRVVRSGGRLRLVEADLIADGVLIARSNCLFLRQTAAPETPTWQAPDWSAPKPDALPTDPAHASYWDVRPIPSSALRSPRIVDQARTGAESESGNEGVLGAMSAFDARQAWTREVRELVAGYDLTPFSRIALAADFVSPLSNSSETSIDFINCDFTVYLHRLPKTDWLGFNLASHEQSNGIATGVCWLYDEAGAIGSVNTVAIAQSQK